MENHGGVEKNSRKTGSRGFDRQKSALFLPPSCEESLHREGNESLLPYPAFFEDLSGRSPAAHCVSFVARECARAHTPAPDQLYGKRAPVYDINPDPDPVLYVHLVEGIEKEEKRVGGDVNVWWWCGTWKKGGWRERKRERKEDEEYLSRWCRNGSAMAEPAWGTHTLFQCWQ